MLKFVGDPKVEKPNPPFEFLVSLPKMDEMATSGTSSTVMPRAILSIEVFIPFTIVAIVRTTQTHSHSRGGFLACVEEETILPFYTRTILNPARCDWVGLRGEFHLPR